jgi:hypothetical protein
MLKDNPRSVQFWVNISMMNVGIVCFERGTLLHMIMLRRPLRRVTPGANDHVVLRYDSFGPYRAM